MDIKSIPAFYCCYLLRSTVRHASLYVGSTPTPARRLAQHNGKVKGGAVRTSRVSLRPWEMTCIVAGFPSNIAALQFEWAWQNAHLTRHISPDERISFATTLTQTSSRTGKSRKRPGRPRTSLIDKLSNLHLLLRVPYFSQWPLEIRFFNEEVYRVWQTWCERVDTSIRPGIKIFLDLPQAATEQEITSGQQPAKRRKIDLLGKGGVEGVDPTYVRFQDVLEKSQFLLDDGDDQSCSVCQQGLDLKHDLYVICPHQVCRNISHVTCLANKFLNEEKGKSVVPTNGKCPSCNGALEWSELMREISLRTRGEKEVLKLLSKKRRTKAATAAEIMETDSEEEDEVREAKELTAVEFDEGYDDDDLISVASLESSCSRLAQVGQDPRFEPTANSLEIVIEDSDSDPDMRF